MYSPLLCELEIDHAIDDFLRDRGLTIASDNELRAELRALNGETFVECVDRVLGDSHKTQRITAARTSQPA